MSPDANTTLERPRTAFISGPLDVSTAYFDRYYRPRIDDAIVAGHHFVVGPVSGIDALALDYLLSKDVEPSRISIYMAGFEIDARPAFVRDMKSKLREYSIVEAKKDDEEDARTTWDRDAAMTRASDYDILRFRTELEQKSVYGDRWMPRVSNTERNCRRRKGQAAEITQIGYVSHWSILEKAIKSFKSIPGLKENEKDDSGFEKCDGKCDAHRDVVYKPLLLGKPAFGFGNDGERNV